MKIIGLLVISFIVVVCCLDKKVDSELVYKMLDDESTYFIMARTRDYDMLIITNDNKTYSFSPINNDYYGLLSMFNINHVDYEFDYIENNKKKKVNLNDVEIEINDSGYVIYFKDIVLVFIHTLTYNALDDYMDIDEDIDLLKIPCFDNKIYQHSFFKLEIDNIIINSCKFDPFLKDKVDNSLVELFTLNSDSVIVVKEKNEIMNIIELPLKE